jgi:hypothetical protein
MRAQFVSGLLSGKSMKESFRNIDWADAAVTAGEAALATVTVGASLVVTRVAASTIRSSVDLSWNEQKIVFGSGEHKKTLNEFATDMISEGFGALAGKLGDNLVDPLIEKAVNNFVRPFFRSSTKKVSRKIYDYTSNFVTNMIIGVKLDEVTVTYEKIDVPQRDNTRIVSPDIENPHPIDNWDVYNIDQEGERILIEHILEQAPKHFIKKPK